MLLNGTWVGWGLGDNSHSDMTVKNAKAYMRRMYASYAGILADTNLFDQAMLDVVKTMQGRLVASGKLTPGRFILGVLDLPTEYAMGFKKKPVPWGISVEGHSSNMWFGPAADTFTQLMGEELCYHQPTGYDNGAIPFDNADGVEQLRLNIVRAGNNDIHAAGFSQGMIIWFDYLNQYGIPKNLKSCLWYGNPCRKLGSVASWARPLVKNPNTHGLDPIKRFGLNGMVDLDVAKIPYADVWREGDIFAQNSDDKTSEVKAAAYQMIARGLGTIFDIGSPFSIASQLFNLFGLASMDEALAIVMAIIGGITFLADPNNPHYSPFDITGGKDWMRNNLKASIAA